MLTARRKLSYILRYIVVVCIIFTINTTACAQDMLEKEKLRLTVGVISAIEELPVIISKMEAVVPLDKINVNVEVFYSWTALEAAFRTGMVDAAGITSLKAFKMHLDKVPLKILMLLHRKGSSLVLSSSESLKGKLIGISGNDTGQVVLLKRYLDKKGLKLGYDVRYILIPFARALGLLREEKISGFILPEPYGSMAQAEGLAKEYILGKDIMANFIDVVLIVNPKKIAENKEAIKEWVDSIKKSGEFIEEDKAKTHAQQVASLQQEILNLDPVLLQRALSNDLGAIQFINLQATESVFEETIKTGLELDILSGTVDLKDIIDDRFYR